MSNGIQSRQNEDISIARLAAQCQLYSEVGNLDALNMALSVLIPFILALLQEFFPAWRWAKIVTYVISVAMLLLSLVFERTIREKKSLAASIQQEFDIYVYSMPWDKKIFGKRKNLNGDVANKSKRILSSEQEKNKLKDWYRPEVDGMLMEGGILACQKENYNWDAGLRKRYRLTALVCVVVLAVIVLVIGLVKNEPLQEWILRIVFILPMIRWLINLWNDLGKDIERLNGLSSELNSIREKTMDDLQFIQKSIYEHRKNAVKAPNIVYNLFKYNDEDRERRIVEMEQRQVQ